MPHSPSSSSIRSILAVLLFATGIALCPATELRVVTFNIETNRDMDGNPTEALNEPGTSDHDSVSRILSRIDADIVCLQELANADVSGGTNGGTTSHIHDLATALGLTYVYIPTNSGVLDFALRNAIISRYPIGNIHDIGSADYMDSIGSLGPLPGNGDPAERAKDVSRVMPAVTIAVPGVADPVTIINLHAKSGTGPANRFRRGVEFDRVGQYLSNQFLDSGDKVIVLGDYNLSQFDDTFSLTPTSGMPGTWNKGTDIPFPITYSIDPDNYWPTPYALAATNPQDLNGGIATFESGSTLDFVLSTPALTELGSEIYRSDLDLNNTDGLSKSGSPLNNSDSTTASDHFAVFADYDLAAQEYVFTSSTETITESFDSFDGTDAPSFWISNPINSWNGIDDGTSDTTGNYAYGTTENALGILTQPATSFTTQYRNSTGSSIQALQVTYDAEQWGVLSGGAADSWSVELIIDDLPTTLAPLTFTADTSGLATPGTATPLSTLISNLAIPDGEAFQLRFTATPGAGVGAPVNEVFINEIHYDNDSSDTGEFVEIVIAPGFTGDATNIALYFYDGLNGGTYSPTSLALSPSTLDATVNGYEIHEVFEAGIQNGPDGLAVVDTRTDTVLEFISYEGSFMATNGPASGMTSTDLGVSQPGSAPIGEGSLGLMGSGSMKSDFVWNIFTGQAHTPGQLNPGQSLTTPGLPSQGIAIDNLSVTLLLDTDDDGAPFISSTSVDTINKVVTLMFTGDIGVNDWIVKGSTDAFATNSTILTPLTLTETAPGAYTVTLDSTLFFDTHFFQIHQP